MRFSLTRWIIPVSCIALLVPALASARVTDATTGLGATGRAAGLSTACSGSATQCVATLLGRILNILFGFLGIVLLGYVLYGGFIWMTAGGNPKAVGQAQDVIRNSVIGVIIIASSFAISDYVIREVANLAVGSGGSTLSGGADSNDAQLDALMDGATRPCCYARTAQSSAPMTACVNDCQRNPTAFSLAPGATENACIDACGSRICPMAGEPPVPTPAPGQSVCTSGGTGPGGGTAPWTLASYCSARTPYTSGGSPRCNTCVDDCVTHSLCTPGDPIYVGGRIMRESDANNQRAHCRETVCTMGATPACTR